MIANCCFFANRGYESWSFDSSQTAGALWQHLCPSSGRTKLRRQCLKGQFGWHLSFFKWVSAFPVFGVFFLCGHRLIALWHKYSASIACRISCGSLLTCVVLRNRLSTQLFTLSFHRFIISFFSLWRREYLVTQEEHSAFAQTKASNDCNKKCREWTEDFEME